MSTMNLKKVGTYKKNASIFFDDISKSFVVRVAGKVSRLIDSLKQAISWAAQTIRFSKASKPNTKHAYQQLLENCATARKACNLAISLRG